MSQGYGSGPPGDFEQRLRSSLHDATENLRHEADAYADMRRRARRQDRVRYAVLAVSTVAAFALVLLLPEALRSTIVTFEPAGPAPSVPAPEQTRADAPSPTGDTGGIDQPAVPQPLPAGWVAQEATQACGGIEQIAAVVTTIAGATEARCVDGSSAALLDDIVGARNPALSPDGSRLVVQEGLDGPLVHLDLRTGEAVFGELGHHPAFAADGRLAWISTESGTPRLVVDGAEAPVDLTAEVSGLAWDAGGDHIYVAAGGAIDVITIADGTRAATFTPDQGTYLAPAAGPEPTSIAFLRRDGAALELVTGAWDDEGSTSVPAELSTQLGDGGDDELYLQYTSAAYEGDFWTTAQGPSWLAGDGQQLWVTAEDDSAVLVAEGVRGAVANRSARLTETPVASSDPPATQVEVEVFYSVTESTDCTEVAAVPRTVEGPGVLRAALEQLLTGPTNAERERGLFSDFSPATVGLLNGVRIEAGVAYVDFDRSIVQAMPSAGSSCGAMALLAQLDATVTQFATVDEAVYSLDGETCRFQEWLQMGSCG